MQNGIQTVTTVLWIPRMFQTDDLGTKVIETVLSLYPAPNEMSPILSDLLIDIWVLAAFSRPSGLSNQGSISIRPARLEELEITEIPDVVRAFLGH